jgi:pimeloyl-ACP methyl ester carboxylesterase
MNLRRLLTTGAVATGAVAATNRLLAGRAADPDPALDGETDTLRWRGMDVAYTEAGDDDAPTLLLLHGINAASSSHEFRTVWDDLAEEYHVVAPDLPGFGRSDRPPLRYSAALYEDFAEFVVGEFDPDCVVATSLTAAHLAPDAEGVEDLILICPTTTAFGDRRPWLRELLRSPVVGEGLYNLMTAKRSIRHADEDHGYYDTSLVTDEFVDFQWTLAHQPGARFAPAAFVAGDLNSDVDLGSRLAEHDADVTLLWGREAETTPLWDGRDLAELADARLVVFDNARLQPHVEHPDAFVDLVAEARD